jgi:hypothetical protein
MDVAVSWFAGLMTLYAVIDRPVPSADEVDELIDFLLDGIGKRG